jgi:hypothetical protein
LSSRAKCPIRHSTLQKTELKLELGQEFSLAEPSSIFNTRHELELS